MADQDIIVKLPSGQTASFPAGTSDETIAAALSQDASGAPPAQSSMDAPDPFGGKHPIIRAIDKVVRAVPGGAWAEKFLGTNPGVAGAVTGGEAGALLGPAGAAGGAILGAGLGAFGGEKYKGASTEDALKSGATEAGTQALFSGAGALAKPVLRAASRRVLQSSLKPVIELVKRTAETQGGEGLNAGSKAVANTVLDAPGFTAASKFTSLKNASDLLTSTADQLVQSATTAGRTVPRAQMENAILNDASKLFEGAKWDPAAVGKAYEWISQKIAAMPNNVSPAILQTFKKDLRAGIENWGMGSTNTAETALRKSVSQTAASGVSRVTPGLNAVNQKLSTVIPARDIADRAAFNASRQDVIPLAAQIAGGEPTAAALSLFRRAGVPIATLGNKLGNFAASPSGTVLLPAAMRAALMSLMGGGQQP